MKIRVHVYRSIFGSPKEREILSLLTDLRIPVSQDGFKVAKIYFIDADLSYEEMEEFVRSVLIDEVIHTYKVLPISPEEDLGSLKWIEVGLLPGVMDSEAMTVSRALREMFRIEPNAVHTAWRVEFFEGISKKDLEEISQSVHNPLIEQVCINSYLNPFSQTYPIYRFRRIEVPLLDLNEKELEDLSRKMLLSLNREEMCCIQDYYRRLGRNPTDIELETIAQTWSEHCQHKTFKSPIRYVEKDAEGKVVKEERIESLFSSYIMKATKELSPEWCLSVFKDNAGVVEFDTKWAVCFKVETHNHPSALEPFGGANTGVGGVIRDVLGCGLGAKPIGNTDVFCFAPPDKKDIPPGVIPPKRMMQGVVSGVRDYGNKMGIPTVNGAIFFDDDFVANPLVYCGTVGVLPKSAVNKEVLPGDKIVLIGGRTGRDGIHGATFSSLELDATSQISCSSAVQIGNPIEEKKFTDVLLRIRDKGWYRAITDCGAGGLSSAVGEMAKGIGAVVYLDRVPLKYSGLSYTEIWISESQERMVLAVKQEFLEDLISAFEEEDVSAVCIGEFTGDGRLRVYYESVLVMDMDIDFLHSQVPLKEKYAEWVWVKREEDLPEVKDPKRLFYRILSSYNVACKEWVIRQYDHEVQGRSVLKPLLGEYQIAPSDASVLRVHLHNKRGIAIGCGINPWYGKIDPYHMAGLCIDEAIRQVVAVGANPDRIAILDNFCWGNPDKPDRLGGLVRAVKGCYDFAVGFGVPFISGKDSLYNEYNIGGQSVPIPGTLLISAIGIVEDIGKVVSCELKKSDSLIYMVGLTKDELGGSQYLYQFGQLGASVPRVDTSLAKRIFSTLSQAIKEGLVLACHDVSDGGLGITVAEMCIGSRIGAEIFLNNVPFQGERRTNEVVLYSESPSRFVVEVDPKQKGRFEKLFEDLPMELIGRTTPKRQLEIYGLEGEDYIIDDIKNMSRIWRSRFRW